MKYKIVTTPTAEQETEEAVLYYESISQGLGIDFLDEIEERYVLLREAPENNSYIDTKNIIRDVQVKRFPFVIIYKVELDRVIIVSVHNTHKNPTH